MGLEPRSSWVELSLAGERTRFPLTEPFPHDGLDNRKRRRIQKLRKIRIPLWPLEVFASGEDLGGVFVRRELIPSVDWRRRKGRIYGFRIAGDF